MKRFVRWWSRYRSSLLFVLLILGAAGLVKATNGLLLVDLNRWFAWPFKSDGRVQQKLLDAQTQGLQDRIQELEAQNRSLKELLDLPVMPSRRKIAAPVLWPSAGNWWKHITLGKGKAEGIQDDAVVVAPGGLVGRVITVTPSTSRVLLVSDPEASVAIIVSRSRQEGVIYGRLEQGGMVVFEDRRPDVKVDDVIVTSNKSILFPPGIVLGRVTKLDLKKLPKPEAAVEFSVPIETLEWVNVLVNG